MNYENIISNLIGATIGGIIATFIAMWQVRKQNKVNENIKEKKLKLICRKLDMYFLNIEHIFKTTYEENRKTREELHINVTIKPEAYKTNFDIISDLAELIDLINESEANELFNLYNKINEIYTEIYHYSSRYTNDSSTEHTQGADESEIVRRAISNLLDCYNKNREILNKLKRFR